MRKHPTSRLPSDEAYWQALTDRVVTASADRLNAYRNVATRWWHGLTRFSMPLAIGAAAALIAALVTLPEILSPVKNSSPAGLYGFAPDDALAIPFLTSAAPTMATLIATRRLERTP